MYGTRPFVWTEFASPAPQALYEGIATDIGGICALWGLNHSIAQLLKDEQYDPTYLLQCATNYTSTNKSLHEQTPAHKTTDDRADLFELLLEAGADPNATYVPIKYHDRNTYTVKLNLSEKGKEQIRRDDFAWFHEFQPRCFSMPCTSWTSLLQNLRLECKYETRLGHTTIEECLKSIRLLVEKGAHKDAVAFNGTRTEDSSFSMTLKTSRSPEIYLKIHYTANIQSVLSLLGEAQPCKEFLSSAILSKGNPKGTIPNTEQGTKSADWIMDCYVKCWFFARENFPLAKYPDVLEERVSIKEWGKENMFKIHCVALTRWLRTFYRVSLDSRGMSEASYNNRMEAFQMVKDDLRSFIGDLLPQIGRAEGLQELIDYRVKDVSLCHPRTLAILRAHPYESHEEDENERRD